MASLLTETVTNIHHWTDSYFSFTTSRSDSFRFQSGQFTMIGLKQENAPIMRAYSIVSAHYEDQLEFFSIKVPDGALTSKLKNIQVGDEILINSKPTGSLLKEQLRPGKNLYLLSTGTGLAPFLSIIKDPGIYESYDKIILTHGCRYKKDLAYYKTITQDLRNHELVGDQVEQKLLYYPTITRETFPTQGRLTDLIAQNQLSKDLGLPALDPNQDRFMICGSPGMLKDLSKLLIEKGFSETRKGTLGEFVVERAFVEQ